MRSQKLSRTMKRSAEFVLYPYHSPFVPGRVALEFRAYQYPVFQDRGTGIVLLHWSRQIGKSFTLAAWAVDRVMTRPGRLVTVLSNSRENGAEFLNKCGQVCERLGMVMKTDARPPRSSLPATEESVPVPTYSLADLSSDLQYKNMRMEVRFDTQGHAGRIKVLAANPRTARGFSGDLILDEFAFQEDSQAIWEAAEPILASSPDYLCRIASTGNGRHNMFYRMASGLGPAAKAACPCSPAVPAGPPAYETSAGGYAVSRVSRTRAYELGTPVYDAITRQPITPRQARLQALDKRAYDQNYELAFQDETTALLTSELISAAEREDVGVICEQDWSAAALALFDQAAGPLLVGLDVGRQRDLSVITVVEDLRGLWLVRGILRLDGMRLPQQQLRLGEVCQRPKFYRAAIDMTGIGLGLFEYAQEAFGANAIQGVNFATSTPATSAIRQAGQGTERVRVTEALATELLRAYEDRRLQHPADPQLREDLRKPEKITTPGGRVSIAATRTEAGHADHFWSLALALEAGAVAPPPVPPVPLPPTKRSRIMHERRQRSVIG